MIDHFILILFTIILIILFVFIYIYYYNIEKFSQLECNGWKDQNYCQIQGESNPVVCFIKKIFCYIVQQKQSINDNEVILREKDSQIENLFNEKQDLNNRIDILDQRISVFESSSTDSNAVELSQLISEKEFLEREVLNKDDHIVTLNATIQQYVDGEIDISTLQNVFDDITSTPAPTTTIAPTTTSSIT